MERRMLTYWHDLDLKAFLNTLHLPKSPIILETLAPEHFGELCQIGHHPDIWRFARYPKDNPESFKKYLERVVTKKNALNLVILDARSNRVIGFTRLKAIDHLTKNAEIGTWLSPQYQANGLNFHAKRELLAVAFHFLELERVYCFVNTNNIPSIKSLTKLGFRYNSTKDCVKYNHLKASVPLRYFTFPAIRYEQFFGNCYQLAS